VLRSPRDAATVHVFGKPEGFSWCFSLGHRYDIRGCCVKLPFQVISTDVREWLYSNCHLYF
jgi:hypothetical protein